MDEGAGGCDRSQISHRNKLNMFVCFPRRDKVLECESDGPRVKVFVSYVGGRRGGETLTRSRGKQ